MDQAVVVFDSASARSASITSPTAGMLTFRVDGTALESYDGSNWVSANSVGGTLNATNVINTLTDSALTAYTFASTDSSKTYRFTSSSAVTATVATSTALTAGQRIDVLQDGTGAVTITAGAGVTFGGAGSAGTAYSIVQYEAASILCVASDTYRIIGNVTAI